MRALKFLVVVMGVLIVMGTVTLVVLIIQRAGGTQATSGRADVMAGAVATLALGEPAGTRIVGLTATADRLVLRLERDGLERVVFIDPKSNQVTGQVILGRPTTPPP